MANTGNEDPCGGAYRICLGKKKEMKRGLHLQEMYEGCLR